MTFYLIGVLVLGTIFWIGDPIRVDLVKCDENEKCIIIEKDLKLKDCENKKEKNDMKLYQCKFHEGK